MENESKVNNSNVSIEDGRILITAKSVIFSGNSFRKIKKQR